MTGEFVENHRVVKEQETCELVWQKKGKKKWRDDRVQGSLQRDLECVVGTWKIIAFTLCH